MPDQLIELKEICMSCANLHVFVVPIANYHAWQNGMCIQDALPELTAADREILISGMCGECFDKLFSTD